jgi:hypothetical protein
VFGVVCRLFRRSVIAKTSVNNLEERYAATLRAGVEHHQSQ